MAALPEVSLGWAGRALIAGTLGITALGLLGISSAVYDPAHTLGLGREALAQLQWLAIALVVAWVAARVPFSWFQHSSVAAYLIAMLVLLAMMVLAAIGSGLVPRIKGQANWLVLTPSLRVQPVEFIKLALLLSLACFCAWPGFNARRLLHVGVVCIIAALPTVLIAKEDLGSALTLVPMIAALLVVAGMRWRHIALMALLGGAVLYAGVSSLPREGPKSYQFRRIDAWLHPELYQAAEGYQAERSLRSVGNGGWLGQGFAQGDQNRLGWVPEKHTDMIISVLGEEFGFVGCCALVLVYLATAMAALALAARTTDPAARLFIAGATGLLIGQMAINLYVATRMMPVTGVTLPFVSYGGSSLLASWLIVGVVLSAARSRRAGANPGVLQTP